MILTVLSPRLINLNGIMIKREEMKTHKIHNQLSTYQMLKITRKACLEYHPI